MYRYMKLIWITDLYNHKEHILQVFFYLRSNQNKFDTLISKVYYFLHVYHRQNTV